MKKAMRLIVSALVACVVLSACSPTAGPADGGIEVAPSLVGKPTLVGDIPCAFPLVAEPRALNILATGYGDVNHEDVFMWQKYAQMTGVDVNWNTVRKDTCEEAVAAALTNRQKVDLILRCRLSTTLLTQYGEGGLILDLAKDDMLQKYAPNCWAYLSSHPDALASVMNPDGTIYALPQINSGAELRVSRKIFVNKKWLENVNMDVPATTEELYELLKAFKELDANGNGDPDDEIPLCSHDWVSVQDILFGAFGLGNRGQHNQLVDYDEETGGVRLIAASDGYRSFLEYLNRLYSEGLLDNRIFTVTVEQWFNNCADDLVGVFAHTNLANVPADKADNWVAVEQALEGPNGDKLWSPVRANFHSTGAAAIPATCADPELALRWLDYFWTDEGTLFYHMGVEGETFEAKPDGSYDYMPFIYDELKSGNRSFDDVVARYSPYPGGGNPTVEIAPYFMGGEMASIPSHAARALFEYGPEEYWPSFTFTEAENEALSVIQTDLEKYCASARIDFITGAKPLSEWDGYREQLERLRMSELLDIYQAAVDRYNALNAAL